MKIKIISRFKMEFLLTLGKEEFNPEDYNIISIIDPEMNFLFPLDNLPENILQLKFHDLEKEDWDKDPEYVEKKGWVIFNDDHARQITKFMDRMDPEKDLIVHCLAGISRSGAIGDYARIRFGLDYERFFIGNKQIIPNAWILKTLLPVKFYSFR